ncbi:hypothetical protein D3C76_1179420 [compost metagenome]
MHQRVPYKLGILHSKMGVYQPFFIQLLQKPQALTVFSGQMNRHQPAILILPPLVGCSEPGLQHIEGGRIRDSQAVCILFPVPIRILKGEGLQHLIQFLNGFGEGEADPVQPVLADGYPITAKLPGPVEGIDPAVYGYIAEHRLIGFPQVRVILQVGTQLPEHPPLGCMDKFRAFAQHHHNGRELGGGHHNLCFVLVRG